MKINHNNISGTGSSGAERANLDKLAKNSQSSFAAAAGAGAGSDRIELSNLSHQLRALSTDSPERTQKLEELSKAVASGNYQVDAKQLSRRIVDDAIRERHE